jgi:predicted nuclease with TOPRIM domain
MADEQISERIEALVKEEHELLDRGGQERGLDEAGHARLQEVKVELDRYWDLLRQRRARRRAGEDPEGASPRDADTVEHYLQ